MAGGDPLLTEELRLASENAAILKAKTASTEEDKQWDRSISLSLSGSMTSTKPPNSGGSTGTVSGRIRIGFFATENFEVGIGGSGTATAPPGLSGFNSGTSNADIDLRWHFSPYERVDPYVSIKGGFQNIYLNGNNEQSGTYGLTLGSNINMSEKLSFFAEYGVDVAPVTGGEYVTSGLYLGMTYYF